MRKILFLSLLTILVAWSGDVSAQSACHLYESGQSAPTGFGTAWNTLTSSRELLIRVTCPSDRASITVGTGAQNQYIYKDFYRWDGSAWSPRTWSGAQLVGNFWYVGEAFGRLDYNNSPDFFVAYVCQWNGSSWKCGCRDSACATGYWQLQAFDPSHATQGGGDTTGGSSSGGGGVPTGDLLALCYPTSGKVVNVSNSSQLSSALSNASPGDRITLASGTYSGTFTLTRSGTASNPIVIAGKSGVNVTGTIKLEGDYAVVEGMTFPNGNVEVKGDHNRVTRNLFRNFKRIAVDLRYGSDNRVDHNEFTDMEPGTAGYVAINAGPDPATNHSKRNRIDHNYLHDFPDFGVNGHEAVWVGSYFGQVTLISEVMLDHNLFDNIDSDGEIIKVSTDKNYFIGNTFLNSKGYASSRQGKDHVWQNNYFEDVDGLRIHGDNHKILGNSFVGRAKLRLIAGDTNYDQVKANLPKYPKIHPSARNVLVSGNKGGVTVGYEYVGGSVPASDNIVEANDGSVSKDIEVRTTIRSNATVNAGSAKKLSPSDVGRSASDPSCQ